MDGWLKITVLWWWFNVQMFKVKQSISERKVIGCAQTNHLPHQVKQIKVGLLDTRTRALSRVSPCAVRSQSWSPFPWNSLNCDQNLFILRKCAHMYTQSWMIRIVRSRDVGVHNFYETLKWYTSPLELRKHKNFYDVEVFELFDWYTLRVMNPFNPDSAGIDFRR